MPKKARRLIATAIILIGMMLVLGGVVLDMIPAPAPVHDFLKANMPWFVLGFTGFWFILSRYLRRLEA